MVDDNMLVQTVVIIILNKKYMQYFITISSSIHNLSNFIIIYVTYIFNRTKLK